MIELYVERWKDATGRTAYFWSVWKDSRQLQRGKPHEGPDTAEDEGRRFCLAALCQPADRVIRL